MKSPKLPTLLFLLMLTSLPLMAQYYQPSPKQIADATMLACLYENTVQQEKSIDVFVLGDKDVYKAFKSIKGRFVGKSAISSVKFGSELPKKTPDVLIVCDPGLVEEATVYCRDNKVLSIGTAHNDCCDGLSLGMYVTSDCDDARKSVGSIKLVINPVASDAEGLDWNPKVSKIARVLQPSDLAKS